MKLTKKQIKKSKGMNAATKANFEKGFKAPVYQDISIPPNQPVFVKVAKGTPYVNPENFN